MKLKFLTLISLLIFFFSSCICAFCAEDLNAYERKYNERKIYEQKVINAIKTTLGTFSAKGNFEFTLFGSITQNGKLTDLKLYKSSGNDGLDKAIMQKISSIEPIALPQEFKGKLDSFSLSVYGAPEYSSDSFLVAFQAVCANEYNAIIQSNEIQSYLRKLDSNIRTSWKPAPSNDPYMICVRFRVKKTGEFDNIQIIKTSGDKKADDYLLSVVNKKSPATAMPFDCEVDVELSFIYNAVVNPYSKSKGAQTKGFWQGLSDLNNERYMLYQNKNPWL